MIESKTDNVNNPKHYASGSIECIDAMIEALGREAVISFCTGNAFKYIWRCNKKHKTPTEDLLKAKWYINKAVELIGEDEH